MKFFTFYHFDSDPRFPPFLLYVRWKSGVTFVRRCFRDVCCLVSFCCMQDVSLVHCAFAVIISTYQTCQMALCTLGGQSLLIPDALKRFCHTYNMKLKICLLVSSSSVIQIICFAFCHLPKPVTLFLKEDAHCYIVDV